MKNENRIKIIYIIISLLTISYIIAFYSKQNKAININNNYAETTVEETIETTTETTTEETTKETTEEMTKEMTKKTVVEKKAKIKQLANNIINVDIIRNDLSIKGEDNSILGIYYYDLPFIEVYDENFVSIETINKINAYLKADYENWLNDESRLNFYDIDRGTWFLEQVNTYVECKGEAYLAKHPFCYMVESEAMFLNENMLSIKQYVYIFGGGPSGMATFGLTFDLKTGEVLTLDKLINVNADELKNKILDYIKKYYSTDCYEEFYEMYKPNENHNFKLNDISKRLDLNYCYYYDGKYYYLILEGFPVYNCSTILKWNGNINDDFEESFNYATWRKNGKYVTEKFNDIFLK